MSGNLLPVLGQDFGGAITESLGPVPRITSLLIKPASAVCNLDCSYCFYLDREADPAPAERPLVRALTVGRGYFTAFGTQLLRGRDFTALDAAHGEAAIVNERFAELYFQDRDPIGRRIELAGYDANANANAPARLVIVGVAPNIRQRSSERSGAFEPIAYLPYASNPAPRASILVRTDAAPAAVASRLHEQVRQLDPDLPLFGVMTLDESFAQSDERLGLLVFGAMVAVVGAIAIVLSTIGVYGVAAYSTTQRTREIGIRVALGARATQIRMLVTHLAVRQLAIGLALGMLGAIGLGGLLRGFLVGTAAFDWVTLLAVGALVAVATLGAVLIPARRAAQVDPVTALRYE